MSRSNSFFRNGANAEELLKKGFLSPADTLSSYFPEARRTEYPAGGATSANYH